MGNPKGSISMAKRTQVILEDDLDGGPADVSLSFSLDGVEYEIDLSAANASALRDAMAGYVGAARKVGGRKRRGSATGGGGSNTAAIRSWGQANGFDVSGRGRVSAEVLEAYERAHA